MRTLTFAILVAIALTVPTLGAIQAASDDAWRSKISPSLAQAMEESEDDKHRAMVVGWPHADPVVEPASRAAWNAYWAEASAAFLGQLEAYAREHEIKVVGAWPSAPSIELVLTREQVEDVARLALVQGISLDHLGAIHVLETFEQGPSVLAGESILQTGAATFWDNGFLGEGVLLAIVDTGIYAGHSMFKDAASCAGTHRVDKWKDVINGRTDPYDDNGHGTHVAGTAAGTNACGGQLNGVAPNVRLMGVKILSGGGSGTWAGAQEGLQWAFDNGADVASNSWGGGDSSGSRSVAQTAENLAKAGMDSVFAGGGGGPASGTIGWPAQADLVVTIGSTDIHKVVSSFSSRGPCSDGRICPDVMAVGSSVTSSWPDGGTRVLSGTSMATPHVGGGAALITQATRTLVGRDLLPAASAGVEKSELEDLLKTHAEDLGAAGPDNTYGWGYMRLDRVFPAILQGSRAEVVLSSTIDDAALRRGESASVVLTLRNVGGQDASGTIDITLSSPDGGSVLETAALDVAAGESATRSYTLAGDELAPGDHDLEASYTYSWRDLVTGAPLSETVAGSVPLRVERAVLALVKALPSNATIGLGFEVELTLANVGNLPVTGATLVEEIPGAYVVTPGSFGGTVSSLWSDPAPKSKIVRSDLSTVMTYDVGDVAPGATWTLRYDLLPIAPGVHAHASSAAYADAGVGEIAAALMATQTVGLVPSA